MKSKEGQLFTNHTFITDEWKDGTLKFVEPVLELIVWSCIFVISIPVLLIIFPLGYLIWFISLGHIRIP